MIRKLYCLATRGNSKYPLLTSCRDLDYDPDVSGLISWVGCPQALQSRKPCPTEKATRIWLVDRAAEVAFGAEVIIGRHHLYKLYMIADISDFPLASISVNL